MTSHEFAKKLLEGPDLLIQTPRVVEYSEEEEDNMRTPKATLFYGINANDEPEQFVLINY